MNQALPLQDLWVLLVEDEPSIAEVFTLILEDAGARVIAATSGTEALNILGSFVPHVLISDTHLPDIDGWLLLARVKALEVERGIYGIPAIAITAHDSTWLEQEHKARSVAARFQKYLHKPVELQNLVDAVAELGHPQKH
ncbi:response regulator [Trichocoleus desertorum AS-A10]|uniref:response regulator n=1 Tax=Trichocoleus desertorum TaxID=1481672 RepID=UPI0032995300